jgi:hypothetical protein
MTASHPRSARLLLAVALAGSLHLTGLAGRAAAQATGGVSLSVGGAPEGELALRPGADTTTSITVGNPASYEQDVEVEATGLRVVDGEFRFDGEPAPGLTVLVEPDRFTLSPGQRRQVLVTLRAGAAMAPGSAYAGLVVRGLPDAGAGASRVVGEVALPLLGRVPGQVADTGRIVTFGPAEPRLAQGPIPFVIEFEATGGVHVTPTGTIELFAGDRSLGLVDVAGQPVLPGTTRRIETTWTGQAPAGTLRARLDLRWGLSAQHHETRDATVEVVAVAGDGGGTAAGGEAGGGRSDAILLLLLGLGLGLLLFLLVLAAVLLARERRRQDQEDEQPERALVGASR